MSLEIFLLLLTVGIFAGLLAGYFGVGGGIIIVPALIWIYSISGYKSDYIVHIAIATSLFTIIFTSISSSFRHWKNENINIKAALLIGISSAITAFLFSKIAVAIPGEVLKKLFSGILILIALKMFFEKNIEHYEEGVDIDKKYNNVKCIVIGLLTGAISAFSGLGGGIFVIPLLKYLLKFPIKRSIGTSSAAILFTAIAGVMGYVINKPGDFTAPQYSFGMVDTFAALPVIIGSIPLSQLGAILHKKSESGPLTKFFAVFIIVVSLKILFF